MKPRSRMISGSRQNEAGWGGWQGGLPACAILDILLQFRGSSFKTLGLAVLKKLGPGHE